MLQELIQTYTRIRVENGGVSANSERTDSSQCANADCIANILLQHPHMLTVFFLLYTSCVLDNL